MRNLVSPLKGFALAFLGMFLIFLGLFCASPQISSVSASKGGEEWKSVELPWIFEGPQKNNSIKVETDVAWYSPRTWQIIPDDHLLSLSVNGSPVSLTGIPPEALRDWGKGFKIDLSDHFKNGINVVEMQFDNGGGPGGLDIRPAKGALSLILIATGYVLLICVLGLIFGLRKSAVLLLCFTLVPIIFYWQETNWLTRSHDVGGQTGHYGYVKYVADNAALPKPNTGWVFYHPPAYYLVGAAVFEVSETFNIFPIESLQALAIVLWLIFLASSIAVFQLLMPGSKGSFWIATTSLVLWPSGIMRSVTLGNDIALYACLGVMTWLICKWWKTGRRALLVWASIFGALSLLIKSNGIVIVAVLGALLLIRFLICGRRKRMKAFVDGLIFGLISFIGLASSFAVRIYFYLKGDLSSWLVSNAGGLGDSLRVPVTIKAFIPLDIPTFLTEPFMSSYDDSTGRSNFWNYLLRSSLTGEFSYKGEVQKIISYGWGFALLVLFMWLVASAANLRHMTLRKTYRMLPIAVLLSVWILSMVAFRILLPFSCSNDFRYITPILVPLIFVWVKMGFVPQAMLWFMSVTSVIFYLSL